MIFNSDYPQLYIAKTFMGSITTVPNNWGDHGARLVIPHSLPFKPLIRGVWSDVADFSWANDLDVYSKTRFGNYPDVAVTSYMATDKDIIFDCASSIGHPVTFYIKGILIAPPDYTGEIQEFDTLGAYKFNSDKRYNKLLKSGELPVGGGNVWHGLGYLPVCWVFEKGQYGSTPVNKVTVTEQELIVRTPSGSGDNGFYFFIFKDGFDG